MVDNTDKRDEFDEEDTPLTVEEVVQIIEQEKIDIDDIDASSENEQAIDPYLRKLPGSERRRLQNMKTADRTAVHEKMLLRLAKLKEIERKEEAERQTEAERNTPEAIAQREQEEREEEQRKLAEAKARTREEYIDYLETEKERLIERVENDADSPNIKYQNDQKLNEIERALTKYKTPVKYYAGEAVRKGALCAAFTATSTGLIVAGNLALNLMTGGAFAGLELSSILIGSAIVSALSLVPLFKKKTVLPNEDGTGQLTRRVSALGYTEDKFESWSGVYGSLKKLSGGNKNNDMVSHEIAEGEGRGSGVAFTGIVGGSTIASLTYQYHISGMSDQTLSSQVGSAMGDAYGVLPQGLRENTNEFFEPVANTFGKVAEFSSIIDEALFPGASMVAAIGTVIIAKGLIGHALHKRKEKKFREQVLAA